MEKHKYGEKLTILEPLDLSPDGKPWGTQARVYLGEIKQVDHVESVAVKFMRTEDERFITSFMRELRILSKLDQGHSVITPVIDCGIVHPSKKIVIDDNMLDFDGLSGTVDHFGNNGLMDLHEKMHSDGFRGIPFVAIQLRNGLEINLEEIVEKGYDCLPVPDVLSISIQIMEILKEAHKNDVIYADSRPIHFYISFQERGEIRVKIIDWNASSILAEEGLDPLYKQKDMKEIFANILFPLFTGRRLANSSESGGRNYTETQMHLGAKYSIDNWKKSDEERLDEDIRALLYDAVVNETIKTPEQAIERMSKICDNWHCNESGDFLQAIQKLHLAYYYLNESHSLLDKVAVESFSSEKFSYVKTEALRLFFIADNMKRLWNLYSNQIKKFTSK